MMPPGPDPLQMTEYDAEQLLYRLLPPFLWRRDDGTLKELVELIADQYWQLHVGLGRLYEALFIETCPGWIVPYIAQSIGVTGLEPDSGPGVGEGIIPGIPQGIGITGQEPGGGPGASQRAWVGRVVGFRQRKGTLATLGRAAIAATGWPTFITPGLAAVGHTPSLRHPGPHRGRWADVGVLPPYDPGAAVFQPLTRTAGISSQPSAGGHQPAVSPAATGGHPVPGGTELSIWRLQAFTVSGRTAHRVRPGAYTFHPLGTDSPLFVAPEVTSHRLAAPDRREMPVPLTRAALTAALRDGSMPPPLAVRVIGQAAGRAPTPRADPRASSGLVAADLTHWTAPAHSDATVIIDPERGRLLFPEPPSGRVVVDYAYGFPGELGGGPYGSATNWAPTPEATLSRHVATPREQDEPATPASPRPASLPDPLDPYAPTAEKSEQSDVEPTLEAALAWVQRQSPHSCVITIDDSATYVAPPEGWTIELAQNQSLLIISAPEAAPTLDGSLHVHGEDGSVIGISGLMLSQTLTYEGKGQLEIEHTTITPRRETALRIRGGMASVSYAILGPIEAGPTGQLHVADTIADGHGGAAITCRAGHEGATPATLDIQRATVLGVTEADVVTAEDCIFAGLVISRQPDQGLITYSYVPAGSTPPRLIECSGSGVPAADGPPETTVQPQFASTRFGNPAYGQLGYTCPPEIVAGAQLGREMGAFNWLRQPARLSRLLNALDEMLPAGRTATVIYRT